MCIRDRGKLSFALVASFGALDGALQSTKAEGSAFFFEATVFDALAVVPLEGALLGARCVGAVPAAEAQGGSFHNGYWRNDANNIFSASTFLKTHTAAATSATKVGAAVQKSKECGEEFAKIAATALG